MAEIILFQTTPSLSLTDSANESSRKKEGLPESPIWFSCNVVEGRYPPVRSFCNLKDEFIQIVS